MKKRIISMLLAVCLVVACTLAITPAVSAVEKTTITATSVTGDIGDVVAVPLVVETPDESDIEWNGLQIYFYPSGSAELLKVVDSEGNESSVGEGGLSALKQHQGNEIDDEEYKSLDYYVFVASKGLDGNTSVSNGDAVVTAYYEITGFQATELLIDVAAISYLDGTKPANLDFDYVPGTISVDGGFEKLAMTADNWKTSTVTGDATKMTTAEAKNYNNSKTGNNVKIKYTDYTLSSDFAGNAAYIDANNWQLINNKISDFMNSEPYDGEEISRTGTKGSTTTTVTVARRNFEMPELTDLYIAADVDLTLEDILINFAANVENIYFVGNNGLQFDFNYIQEDSVYETIPFIDAMLRIDPDADYGVDGAPYTVGKISAWDGSKVFEFFTSTDVLAYIQANLGELTPNLVKLDSFTPIGYQGPAEITGKKFRVDSAIKYADTQFTVDEEPKNIYDTASCNITVKGKAGGENIDKKYTANIGTVYKSLSSKNGVAVPACDAYYFSALVISDLPELQEGEELVFTFTNTVTNIFGGETTSAPKTLTYHADGTID